MTDKGCSQRRACGLVGLEPKTYRYISRRPDDEPIRQRLRALASERRRFGIDACTACCGGKASC
jgi:putative transposase